MTVSRGMIFSFMLMVKELMLIDDKTQNTYNIFKQPLACKILREQQSGLTFKDDATKICSTNFTFLQT